MKLVQRIDAMLACPSDAEEYGPDIDAAKEAINADTDDFILRIRHWKADSTAHVGGDPQESIDSDLLDNSDILLAIFRHTLGSAGANGESATVHEIQRAVELGKEAAILFSREGADVYADETPDNLERLRTFRKWCEKQSIFYDFSDRDKLRHIASHQLLRLARKILRKTGAGAGPTDELAGRADSAQATPSGEQLYFFSEANRERALELFPRENNQASSGTVSASSTYRDTDASRILAGSRRGDVWLCDRPTGNIEVKWDPPIAGRHLLLINRCSGPGRDSWCESLLLANGQRIDRLHDDFSSDRVVVVDFGRDITLRAFSAELCGTGHPGLAGLEVHRNTPEGKRGEKGSGHFVS